MGRSREGGRPYANPRRPQDDPGRFLEGPRRPLEGPTICCMERSWERGRPYTNEKQFRDGPGQPLKGSRWPQGRGPQFAVWGYPGVEGIHRPTQDGPARPWTAPRRPKTPPRGSHNLTYNMGRPWEKQHPYANSTGSKMAQNSPYKAKDCSKAPTI